jgi:hypothetical protein
MSESVETFNVFGNVTEQPIKRKFVTGAMLRVEDSDSTAAIGKLFAEAGRQMGSQLTTTIAQNPGTYNVDILITVTEV